MNATCDEGWTPLYSTVKHNLKEVAKLLVENGAKLETKTKSGATPLALAIQLDKYEMARELKNLGSDVNFKMENGLPLLHIIIQEKLKSNLPVYQHLEILKFLLKNGAEIEARSRNGHTPLLLATSTNQIEMVKVLLHHGANPGAKLNGNETSLHLATRLGLKKIAEVLVKSGAQLLNEKDKFIASLGLMNKRL